MRTTLPIGDEQEKNASGTWRRPLSTLSRGEGRARANGAGGAELGAFAARDMTHAVSKQAPCQGAIALRAVESRPARLAR